MTNDTRKPTYEELEARLRSLQEELDRALARIEELERKAKRPAGPFSKGDPVTKPKKPGRKPGQGKWCTRRPPERIDETIEVPLAECCPCCGGEVRKEKVVEQHVIDLPQVQPVHRRFRIEVGQCGACGKRVQARHPLQTSNATGAAAVQIGPNALAFAGLLNKAYGLSWGKVQALFARGFGLEATKAAFTRATVERLARKAAPVYDELVGEVRAGQVVCADETSWKVAGHLNWLWVFTNATTTVYKIAKSRGWDVIAEALGAEFDGTLVRDGWGPYRRLLKATHQTCLAHFFKRIADILELAQRGAARFPRALRRFLKAALELRDHRERYTPHGFASLCGKLSRQLDALLRWKPTYRPNRLLANHLRRERDAVLTFLGDPAIDATNWRAEQGLRPAVVNRKVCGGNRTSLGAQAQTVLTSVIRTCTQRGHDAIQFFVNLLRGSPPTLQPAVAPTG